MSAYSAAVLADNPRHYWRFSDPGGQLARDLGSSKLALHAGFYQARLGYSGPVSDGGSAFFTDQGVLWYPRADQAYAAPLTLECWFWQTFDNGAEQKVFSTENGTTYLGLGVGMAAGRKPEVFSFNSALISGAAIPLNTWTHIVGRHDGTTRDLLVNGVLIGSGLQAFTNGNGDISTGGRATDRATFAEGFVSEVAMYGAALSTARCLAHYNAADQVAAFPTYQAVGSQSPITGAPVFSAADVAQILAAVQKTFPTT